VTRKLLDASINPEKLNKLNRFILQEGFNEKLTAMGRLNLSITQKPKQGDININEPYMPANTNINVINKLESIPLNPQKGEIFSKKVLFGGYDESKLQFITLEGIVNITSHSLVEVTSREYIPIGYISIYFYTRSKDITEKSEYVKYSLDPEADSNRDYAEDRNKLIQNNAVENSILFIDGPFT
jgi:hypothetical protein